MAPSRALLLSARSLFQHARLGASSRRHFSSNLATPTLRATSGAVHRLLNRGVGAVVTIKQQQSLQQRRSLTSTTQRNAPSEDTSHLTDGEKHVFEKLTEKLQPARLEVKDVSGGCGSMYAIEVASKKFEGLSIMKQHRLVNSILADEIKSWHGLQLRTAPS